jgi:hypothetical protein
MAVRNEESESKLHDFVSEETLLRIFCFESVQNLLIKFNEGNTQIIQLHYQLTYNGILIYAVNE